MEPLGKLGRVEAEVRPDEVEPLGRLGSVDAEVRPEDVAPEGMPVGYVGLSDGSMVDEFAGTLEKPEGVDALVRAVRLWLLPE